MDKYVEHRRARTQAMLDEAVARARNGERVLVLVHDQQMVDYFRAHITNVMGVQHDRIVIRSAQEGGGAFLSLPPLNALLIDHFVFEVEWPLNFFSLLSFLRTRIVPVQR